MANLLKHRFVSAVTDSVDATKVQPSHWNDGHAFSGGIGGNPLVRDPTDASYGAAWGGNVTETGNVIFSPDNTYDIGQSGGNRPRNLYLAGGLTTNGQIVFPATANPSASANVLDDYREGLWTPIISASGGASGQTYAVQVGEFVKVGRQVTLMFQVALSVKGTLTGNITLANLPFVITNVYGGSIGFALVGAFSLATTWYALYLNFIGGNTFANVNGINALTSNPYGVNLTATDLTASSGLFGSVSYLTT